MDLGKAKPYEKRVYHYILRNFLLYLIFFYIFHGETKLEKKIFLSIFFLSLILFGFQTETLVVESWTGPKGEDLKFSLALT